MATGLELRQPVTCSRDGVFPVVPAGLERHLEGAKYLGIVPICDSPFTVVVPDALMNSRLPLVTLKHAVDLRCLIQHLLNSSQCDYFFSSSASRGTAFVKNVVTFFFFFREQLTRLCQRHIWQFPMLSLNNMIDVLIFCFWWERGECVIDNYVWFGSNAVVGFVTSFEDGIKNLIGATSMFGRRQPDSLTFTSLVFFAV